MRPRSIFLLLTLLLIAAAISVSGCGNSEAPSNPGSTGNAPKAAPHVGVFKDLPQEGDRFGNPAAPVTVFEYGDLQCTFCKNYQNLVFPDVVKGLVKKGRIKYVFKNVAVVGEGSTAAAYGALAAKQQGRYFDYIQTFYDNQKPEGTQYVTQPYLESIAEKAGLDVARWNSDLSESKIAEYNKQLAKDDAQARSIKLKGTPSFLVVGPTGKKVLLSGVMPYSEFNRATKRVMR